MDDHETIEFLRKTRLTINALGGDDIINLNNFDTPEGMFGQGAGIFVNGGDPTGSDTVIVNGSLGFSDFIVVDRLTASGAHIVGAQPIPVTVDTVEHLLINGLGGDIDFDDDLVVMTPSGAHEITLNGAPGQTDAGTIAVREIGGGALLPLSFSGLGGTGSLFFEDEDFARVDTLVYNGTANDDTFTLPGGTGAIRLNSQIQVNTGGVANVFLNGQDGDDTFNLAGSQDYNSVVLSGGDPSASDTVNLSAATGAVNVTVGASTTVTGYGATVSLLGVEHLNADVATNDATFTGTASDDTVDVTPTGVDAVTFSLANSNPAIGSTPVVNFSNVGATMTLDGGLGTNLLNFHGTANSDSINLSRSVGNLTLGNSGRQVVTTTSSFLAWNVLGKAGSDSFVINESVGALNIIQLNIDGGTGAANSLSFNTNFVETYLPAGGHDGSFRGGAEVNFTNIASATVSLSAPSLSATVRAGGGANQITVNGTGANTVQVTVDDGTRVTFAGNLTTLNVNAGAGDDVIAVTPGAFTGAGGINVDGGDPTASDLVIVNGTAGADNVTIDTLTADGARIAGLGAVVSITTTEHLKYMGHGGDDELTIVTPSGSDIVVATPTLASGQGSTTITSGATGDVRLPLSWKV